MWNHHHLHAFHYQKWGHCARVLSHFVGGAPLICAPWHHDICEWVTTDVTFLLFPLSHHVSTRADSKICTHMLANLSTTYVWHRDYLKFSLYILLPVKLTWCWILFFFKGVTPTSFTGQCCHHQDIKTYLQETASSLTVPYHSERRGNQAAPQQNPVLHDEIKMLAMSSE